LFSSVTRWPTRTRTAGWSFGLRDFLIRHRVSANRISWAGMVAGVMAGACLAATAIHPVSAPWLWIATDLGRRRNGPGDGYLAPRPHKLLTGETVCRGVEGFRPVIVIDNAALIRRAGPSVPADLFHVTI